MEQNKKDQSPHHVTPVAVYVKVLLALLVLTVLTVAVSYVDFGKANIFVSMGIATIKAALVMMFFMGLKYDTVLNRTIILSSFVAVALFLGLSASDLWTRPNIQPVKVAEVAAGLSLDDVKRLEISTPELVAHGKEIFAVNCTPCHGPNGEGNGVAGAALNPKPRNFHGPISAWKNGTSTHSMYVTLAYGINGGAMASYKSLPPADRYALIHFLHTWTPEIQTASAADSKYEAALKDDGIGAGSVAAKATMPVDFAISRMVAH